MIGLEDVDQRLLDKLEGAGVLSFSDLATSTASELLEEYYSNYDDNVAYVARISLDKIVYYDCNNQC